MTPAEQDAQNLEIPFSVRLRQQGGMNVLLVSTSGSEMDALCARIRSQSKAVVEHIAADAAA